ncbi:MAG: hypothetical protein ACLRJV_22290 [Eubacteriales bacterium]
MVERFACESVFQNTKCYEQCGKQVSHHAYEPDREVHVCATRCWTGFMLCAGNMNPEEG